MVQFLQIRSFGKHTFVQRGAFTEKKSISVTRARPSKHCTVQSTESRKAIKVREHGLDGHSSAVLANAILLMSYVAHSPLAPHSRRTAVPAPRATCMNGLDFYNNDFLHGAIHKMFRSWVNQALQRGQTRIRMYLGQGNETSRNEIPFFLASQVVEGLLSVTKYTHQLIYISQYIDIYKAMHRSS